MPIVANDLVVRLSVKSGTAGNQTVQANPNLALGRYMSLTAWAGGVLHDLFDAVTGTVNEAMTPSYRCVFLYNTHATLTWTGPVAWLTAQATGAPLAIGVDTTAASAAASAPAQALEIASATVAPVGVTFASPTTQGAGIAIGDIGPGQCRAIWLRSTPVGGGAVDADQADLRFSGDSAA